MGHPLEPLSITGELDKLAFNSAIGRNYVGQHFRTEAETSLRFGEEIAISFLKQRVCETSLSDDTYGSIRIDLFNRTRIRIGKCGEEITYESFVGPSRLPPPPPSPPRSPPSPPSPPLPPPVVTPLLTPVSDIVEGPSDERHCVLVDSVQECVLPASPQNFLRLVPKPTLSFATATGLPSVRYISFTQRSMSFGDSTTRLASVTVNGADTFSVEFGLPSPDGSSGTCLTDHIQDSYGRACMNPVTETQVDPSPILVDLGGATDIVSLEYTVQRVYPYDYPFDESNPPVYGGRGGFKSSRTTKPDSGTDTLFGYGKGSWDVGLVMIKCMDSSMNLVGESFVSDGVVTDNTNYNPDAEDAKENPFLNPYRPSTCRNVLSACSVEEDRFYVPPPTDRTCLPDGRVLPPPTWETAPTTPFPNRGLSRGGGSSPDSHQNTSSSPSRHRNSLPSSTRSPS